MARTQEERRTETRGLLLDAASDLFAHKGFHNTTAEAVAAAAGRTTGALYDHFGGKEGLLVALLERWVERRVVDLTEQIEGAPDLDHRLGAMWQGVVDEADSDGATRKQASLDGDKKEWLLLELELWLHAARDPQLGVVGAERFEVMRAGLAQGLTEWAHEYELHLPSPAPEVAVQVIALLIGAAIQHRLDPASVPRHVVVDGLRHLFDIKGVGK